MLIAYISILIICLLAFANFFIFKSFYGLEFQLRFVAVQEGFRNRLIEANNWMEKKLRNQLAKGEEPDELMEFGEIWKKRLAVIKTLDVERERMDGHIRFVYYMLGFGFIHAWVATLYHFQVSEILGVPIFFMTGAWFFIFFAGFLMVVYIILYRDLGKTLTKLEKELNLVD